MGASRKLQTEMERVLKKVNEGLLEFSSIWDKLHRTNNVNLKDKLEADLKKEIKKLQRFREQIKTWQQSSEIKDRKVDLSYEGSLMEARKQIESEMERFKICEKEMKTKAFSKEGLGQLPRTDPKEKAKSKTRDWLNNVVTDLENQIDNFEAELEKIPRKKGKTKNPQLVHLETSISRHKAHIKKLELVLRLLDNDELSPYQVNDNKYYIEDYIEHNQSEFERFGNIDELYASLPLDMIEALEDTLGVTSFIKPTTPFTGQERCDEVNSEDKKAHTIPKELKTVGPVSAVVCDKPVAVSLPLSSQSSNLANERDKNITSTNTSSQLASVQECSVSPVPFASEDHKNISSATSVTKKTEGSSVTFDSPSRSQMISQHTSVITDSAMLNDDHVKTFIPSLTSSQCQPQGQVACQIQNESQIINPQPCPQNSLISTATVDDDFSKPDEQHQSLSIDKNVKTDKDFPGSNIQSRDNFKSQNTNPQPCSRNSMISTATVDASFLKPDEQLRSLSADRNVKTEKDFPDSNIRSRNNFKATTESQITNPQLCSRNSVISTSTVDTSFLKADEQLQNLSPDKIVKTEKDLPDSNIKSRDNFKAITEVTDSATEGNELPNYEDQSSSVSGLSYNDYVYHGTLRLLEAAMLKLPDISDRKRQHAPIPSSFPDTEMYGLRTPQFWHIMRAKSLEILLFAYHFQQGTYLQHMAGLELEGLNYLCSEKHCRLLDHLNL